MPSVKRVAVIYATAHGSTREIAMRIAARLTERDLLVDVAAAADDADVRPYDAFVIGSAIHDQAWLPAAIGFVRYHAAVLDTRPVWLFSVGMPDAMAPRLRKWAALEGPKVTEPLRTRIHSRGEHLFSGEVRAEHLPAFGRLIFRMAGGHFGDFRNDDEIDRWADGIAAALGATEPATGTICSSDAPRPARRPE